MNHIKTFSSIILLFIVISISACTNQNNDSEINAKKTIIDEINRLNSLNSNESIKTGDFLKLEGLLSKDENALDEINEIKVMVKYEEYYHVYHGLGFLTDYIKSGKKTLCPGHSLSHYYVFIRHNETDLANDNFKEAKDVFQKWIPLAKAYAANNKILNFDNSVLRIQNDINNIYSGNITGSDEEIEWLSSDGSICV